MLSMLEPMQPDFFHEGLCVCLTSSKLLATSLRVDPRLSPSLTIQGLEHTGLQWLSEGWVVFNQCPSSAYHQQYNQSIWSACSSGLPTSTFALCSCV